MNSKILKNTKMLNRNTYFQMVPLVAQEFTAAPCPYSLIPI